MKKQAFVLLLCLCLLLTVASAPALASDTVVPDATTTHGALLNLDNQLSPPSGYNAASTLHPYGINKENFMLMAHSELFLFTSYNLNTSSPLSELRSYNRLIKLTGNNSELDAGELSLTTGDGQTVYNNSPYSFIEAVAFDPTGNGQKDHIAYVGFSDGSNSVVAWVLNTKTKTKSDIYTVYGNASWMLNDFEQFKAGNFFSITAGDYNGDGKDTLVCYRTVGDESNAYKPDLVELSFDPAGNKLTQRGSRTGNMLHPLYLSSVATWTNAIYDDHKWQLGACLTSGDYNSDGFDDLAVVSYTNNIDNGDYYDRLYEPYLAVAYGIKDEPISHTQIEYSTYLYSNALTMSTPSIATGDIDGDGRAEMIMAGYYATITKGASDGANSSRTISDDNYLYAAYLGVNDQDTMEAPTYFTVNIDEGVRAKADMSDLALAPIAVECVATDGPGAAEKVFIGHSLYSIGGANATKLFSIDDVAAGGSLSYAKVGGNRNVVSSLAAGNFDGNENGMEQLFLTLGYKEDKNEDDYTYVTYAVGKDDQQQYFGRCRVEFTNKGDNCNQKLNCIVVAADCDNDGVKARYNSNGYFYANPDIKAVLQASPHFSELGDWADFQGGTSYGYAQTYSFGGSSSHNVSFGVGVTVDVDAMVASISTEAGYTMDWNSTFEKAQTKTYSTTFTAGPSDLVVIARTPVFNYYYDIYDTETGEWIENAMGVSVMQTPLIYRLSIEQYNKYVEAYNKQLNDLGEKAKDVPRLIAISDSHLHNEGSPFGYYNTAGSLPAERIILSNETYPLGYGGGMTDFEFSEEVTETFSQDTTHGVHFAASASAGLVVEVGAYTELNYSKGAGTFKSHGEIDTTSGSVADLISGEQSAAGDYGFNWQFFTWKINLGKDNEAVPVYGYLLSNLNAPTPAVTDLTVDEYDADSDTYKLKWLEPDATGRTANKGYNVYVKQDNGTLNKLNGDTLVTNTEYSFSYNGSYSDVFVVTAMGVDNIESALSNEVIYFKGANGKSAYQLAMEGGYNGTLEEWLDSLAGSSAYEIAVEQGYNGTVQQWLTSLRGDTGLTGDSAYDLAVKNGYSGSLNDWLSSLRGAVGEQGVAGQAGETGKSAYEIAVANGFTGTEKQWLASLAGDDGSSGSRGKDGVGIADVKINEGGYLIVTLTDGSSLNAGSVRAAQHDPDEILDLYTDSPFRDVLKTFWYADSVDFCYNYDLMGGTSTTAFSPNLPVTRGMIVTVLYRLEGSPGVYGSSFSDVKAGQYYSDSVAWAALNNLVDGYGNNRFAPNDVVTYEQAVTILYRYASYRQYDSGAESDLTRYSDAARISDYALPAMQWAEGSSLIAGKSGALAPSAAVKRCELASLLHRFCLYSLN